MNTAVRRNVSRKTTLVIAESKELLTHNIDTIANNMELKSQPESSRCENRGVRAQERKVGPELTMS